MCIRDRTKPATSSTYNPYSDMDADKKKSDAATADSVSAEPVYKLVIDENVVEKISSCLLYTSPSCLPGRTQRKRASAHDADRRTAAFDL